MEAAIVMLGGGHTKIKRQSLSTSPTEQEKKDRMETVCKVLRGGITKNTYK